MQASSWCSHLQHPRRTLLHQLPLRFDHLPYSSIDFGSEQNSLHTRLPCDVRGMSYPESHGHKSQGKIPHYTISKRRLSLRPELAKTSSLPFTLLNFFQHTIISQIDWDNCLSSSSSLFHDTFLEKWIQIVSRRQPVAQGVSASQTQDMRNSALMTNSIRLPV